MLKKILHKTTFRLYALSIMKHKCISHFILGLDPNLPCLVFENIPKAKKKKKKPKPSGPKHLH